MTFNLAQLWHHLAGHRRQMPPGTARTRPAAQAQEAGEWRQYQQAVDAALKEWQAAEAFFQTVNDPDLVDYAIYTLEAARRKYMYLLKQAQRLRARREEV